MITLKLAFRNIMRQKTRTALTVAAITFCTFAILLMMAVTHGTHQQMIETSVSLFMGHFQVQAEGYLADPSLNKSFQMPAATLAALDRDPRVKGVALRISAGGLLSTDQKTAGGMFEGVDPAREPKATNLFQKISAGRPLKPGDDKAVILGRDLAENLGVAPGDEVQILAQSYYGTLELDFFKVVGIIKTGMAEFDQVLVMLPLAAAQDLFQMPGLITEAAVTLDSEEDKDAAMAMTRQSLSENGATRLRVEPWETVMPELVEFLLLDNAGGVLYLAILVFVVAFVVLLTITMSVMERVREFGVLIAIGTKPRRIFLTIIFECLMIGTIGTALGLLLGSIPAYYWSIHPIDLSRWGEVYEQFGLEPKIWTMLLPSMYWGTALIMLAITGTMSLFPALRAVRIKPAQAMRHV